MIQMTCVTTKPSMYSWEAMSLEMMTKSVFMPLLFTLLVISPQNTSRLILSHYLKRVPLFFTIFEQPFHSSSFIHTFFCQWTNTSIIRFLLLSKIQWGNFILSVRVPIIFSFLVVFTRTDVVPFVQYHWWVCWNALVFCVCVSSLPNHAVNFSLK